MSHRTAHRRHQALAHSLAGDKVADIWRQLGCAKRWLYTWRRRYDATKATWAQERSTRPKNSPTHTPAHVVQAIVSLSDSLRHHGTRGSATVTLQAFTQQGIEPGPSRRTCTVFCAATTGRESPRSTLVNALMTGCDRLHHTAKVVNGSRVLLLTRA